MRFWSYLREHRLVSGVSILAATQFAASLAGLIRDRLLASTFEGNLGVVDAYIAAFRPSDFLFQTCIISALGTVLVPVLARYRAEGKKEEMSKVLNGTMGIAALIFGVIALILGLTFQWIAPILVKFTSEELVMYVKFGRMALLINFLFVFGNAYGQYLITVQRYWVYGLTPVIYTLGTIVGTVFFTPIVGPMGPILGTLLGAVIYVILRMIAVWRIGAGFGFTLWHPDIPEMGKLMLPRILSLGALQAQLLYLDRIASGLPEGSLTINTYARNFQSVLVGVVGIAVAQSVYSILSQAAARGDQKTFRKYLRTGTKVLLTLTLPGAALLVVLAPVAARLVDLEEALRVFSLCIFVYALSIPFESMGHLLLRAFYARKDTLTPASIGVVGGVTAILISSLFVNRIGIFSIAAGFTAAEMIKTAGLWFFLRRALHKEATLAAPTVTPQEQIVNDV